MGAGYKSENYIILLKVPPLSTVIPSAQVMTTFGDDMSYYQSVTYSSPFLFGRNEGKKNAYLKNEQEAALLE